MNRGAKYYASFIVGVANSMEYRFDFFMNLLSTIFPIIMQVFLWNVMFSGAGTDRMYGYTFSQMILYVVMAGAVSKFTSTGVENAVNDDIHSGGLAKFVVKPVNYIFFRLTGAIGQKFSAMVTMLGLTAASLFVLRFIVNFSIKPESVILFIFSLALAVILNFYIFFCISMIAFWLTLFVGTYVFMTGIWMLLSGVNDVPRTVINGGLDLLMTKPGSLQFLQTFGKYNFGLMLPNIIAGMVLIILGWMRSGIESSLLNIALFLFYMACAVLLTYAFSLISSLLIFWITSVNAVYTMYCALWDYNNMPMELYPKIIKQIGTFIIPIFLITNWQGMAILGKLSVSELIWGACFPIVAFLLSRLMWTRGIRKYISANG